MKPEEAVYEALTSWCKKVAELDPGMIRIAKGEADDSTEACPEANEFLKLDEKRAGRDLKLYRFMAKMGGVGCALADFAAVVMAVKAKAPGAYRQALGMVIGWAGLLEEDDRESWAEIWEEGDA